MNPMASSMSLNDVSNANQGHGLGVTVRVYTPWTPNKEYAWSPQHKMLRMLVIMVILATFLTARSFPVRGKVVFGLLWFLARMGTWTDNLKGLMDWTAAPWSLGGLGGSIVKAEFGSPLPRSVPGWFCRLGASSLWPPWSFPGGQGSTVVWGSRVSWCHSAFSISQILFRILIVVMTTLDPLYMKQMELRSPHTMKNDWQTIKSSVLSALIAVVVSDTRTTAKCTKIIHPTKRGFLSFGEPTWIFATSKKATCTRQNADMRQGKAIPKRGLTTHNGQLGMFSSDSYGSIHRYKLLVVPNAIRSKLIE